MMGDAMYRDGVFRGAVILTFAGVLSKIIGALYRIPLFRMIGAEGMGIYQMAYPIYVLLLTVSSAGIPVAISKLIAERVVARDSTGTRNILLVGLLLMVVVGIGCTLILYASAEFLARDVLKDPRAYYSVVAIAPAVALVGLMSVLRGYFQGFQTMYPTAFSQVIEQVFRVVAVLVGAYLFLPKGIHFAAAAATSGAVAGAVAGLAILMVCFIWRDHFLPPMWGRYKNKSSLTLRRILYRIAALALPISIGGLVLPMVQILDAITVPMRLQHAGFSVAKASELYGELTGGAVTLVNVPTIVTLALATSLVPVISELRARNNRGAILRNTNIAVAASVALCLPAAVGLFLLAEPIADLLFNCPEAGIPLSILAPAAVFLGLHQTTSGILQGFGKTYLPVKNLAIGVVIKLGLNYYLTALPALGIKGAAVGTVAGFGISSLLNCLDISRVMGWRPAWYLLSKPVIAATIMALGVYFLYRSLILISGAHLATLLVILLGAAIYIVVLLIIDRGERSLIGHLLAALKR